jgi:hypothetical protein
VVWAYDVWAGSAGSKGYAVDVRHYLEKSHPALAKPRSEGEAIVGELREHRRPDAALKEIKEIRSDQKRVKQFVVQTARAWPRS